MDAATARSLEPEGDEVLVLTVLQQLMLGRDLIAERSAEKQEAKRRFRDGFAEAAVAEHWSRADLPRWARAGAAAIAAKVPSHQRAAVEEAAAAFGDRVAQRSRALTLLIELVLLEPWPDGLAWVPRARTDALAACAGHLTALRAGDLDAVLTEVKAVTRALTRRDVAWGRLAVASAAGLALGVATMGVAAPLIGAAIGGTFGLSGAAAASAGLAWLGGGSVAAGGFGMAGGTMLLTGIGAVGGAGVVAAGSHVTGWSVDQVVAGAVKLDVLTRLVVLDAEGDDEKARRVVEGLQARLDEITTVIARLTERLQDLTADNQRLTGENDELRRTLEAERSGAEQAGTALRVVIERIAV